MPMLPGHKPLHVQWNPQETPENQTSGPIPDDTEFCKNLSGGSSDVQERETASFSRVFECHPKKPIEDGKCSLEILYHL